MVALQLIRRLSLSIVALCALAPQSALSNDDALTDAPIITAVDYSQQLVSCDDQDCAIAATPLQAPVFYLARASPDVAPVSEVMVRQSLNKALYTTIAAHRPNNDGYDGGQKPQDHQPHLAGVYH